MIIFFYILFGFSVFIPLVPITSILLNFRKFKRTHLITITGISVCSITTDLVSWLLSRYASYNIGIQHLYTLIIGSLLFYYFFTQFRNKSYWVLGGYMVFIATCVMSAFYWGGLEAVNTIPYSTLAILIIIFALAYFVKAINELKYNRITHDMDFWINFGLLLLYGTTLFISLFESYIRDSNLNMTMQTWPIIYVANILFSVILTVGIWHTTKRIS